MGTNMLVIIILAELRGISAERMTAAEKRIADYLVNSGLAQWGKDSEGQTVFQDPPRKGKG